MIFDDILQNGYIRLGVSTDHDGQSIIIGAQICSTATECNFSSLVFRAALDRSFMGEMVAELAEIVPRIDGLNDGLRLHLKLFDFASGIIKQGGDLPGGFG